MERSPRAGAPFESLFGLAHASGVGSATVMLELLIRILQFSLTPLSVYTSSCRVPLRIPLRAIGTVRSGALVAALTVELYCNSCNEYGQAPTALLQQLHCIKNQADRSRVMCAHSAHQTFGRRVPALEHATGVEVSRIIMLPSCLCLQVLRSCGVVLATHARVRAHRRCHRVEFRSKGVCARAHTPAALHAGEQKVSES